MPPKRGGGRRVPTMLPDDPDPPAPQPAGTATISEYLGMWATMWELDGLGAAWPGGTWPFLVELGTGADTERALVRSSGYTVATVGGRRGRGVARTYPSAWPAGTPIRPLTSGADQRKALRLAKVLGWSPTDDTLTEEMLAQMEHMDELLHQTKHMDELLKEMYPEEA